jgi:hypothetical protein
MKNAPDILVKIVLFIFIFALFGGVYFLYTRQERILKQLAEVSKNNISDNLPLQLNESPTPSEVNTECSDICRSQVESLVSSAVATLSGKTQKVITTTTSDSSKKTSYIPLGTTMTTQSTDWVDVEDSEVYIDSYDDYGEGAKISFEASLKVAYGNGKAFARIYDDTNKIAVDYSEISTENNDSFQQVSSGNLPFWRGRNLYKVQIKSLNSFEVTYSGGKLKIVY